jgi:hypothetical protein
MPSNVIIQLAPIMNRTFCFTCVAFILLFLGAACARAEETNLYPKSRLELFEERSGVVIIRGTENVGSVPGKRGEVTVQVRETKDMTFNQRDYGVIVFVAEGEGFAHATYVDYDELPALIQNLDYVSKVNWSLTSLGHFDASYTTRAGLRVATYSSTRSGLIEGSVVTQRLPRSRASFTTAQLDLLRNVLEAAKAKIEELQKTK